MKRNFLGQGLALGMLALSLSACGLFGSGSPRVSSVDPEDGATQVGINSSVRATLALPGSSELNALTLTDTAVSLTDASGAAVPATRAVEGSTLVLDPTADLAANTAYTFNVTSEVRTTDGTALTAFTSGFTTSSTTGPVPDGGLTFSPERVVFTAGGASSSDTRTLTLTNTGTEVLNVSGLSIGGTDAAQFALADSSSFSLESGASRDLSLTFSKGSNGPTFATLNVQSDDATTPNLEVPLGGLGVAGQGGNNEPSLQWILDTYGLAIDTGDDDPSTTGIVDSTSVTNGPLGDEVAGKTFTKADPTAPVTAEVLAAFGVENDPVLEFGYYAAGQDAARTELFDVQQTPALNAQRLAPEVTGTGGTVSGDTVTFDPGTSSFGLYSFWPTNRFFGERYVYTEDTLNTFADAIPHQVRIYPLVSEANAYVVATEEFSQGFDYNDIVVIVRNIVPAGEFPPGTGIPPVPNTPPANGITGLNISNESNELGEPYNDRLALQRINSTVAPPCDPATNPDCDPNENRYEGIEFPTTGTVNLQNTGGSPLQLSLSFQNDNLFVFPNGESTLTLQPGQGYDLEVEFNPVNATGKGVYPAGLLIQSGGQSAGVQLAGLYMRAPEGGREVFLGPLANDLFGYDIDLGTTSQGKLQSPEIDSPLSGEEVRSALWEAANPGGSVNVLQLAALHTCCNRSYSFGLHEPGSSSPFAAMKPDPSYGQSIYPREGNSLTQLSANPTGPFEIYSAGYSSDPGEGTGRGRLGVRFWPLKDRSGNLIANTYLIAQDFVRDGCQSSNPTNPDPTTPDSGNVDVGDTDVLSPQQGIVANCDYNDNMYIIENVRPVN